MLSRERATAYTQVLSKPPYLLPPEFVFKGKGKRITLNPPEGVHAHWAEKASYRVETMLDTIKYLPNNVNPWTCKDYAIYVLDNYSVHQVEEVTTALLSKGYVPVLIGGGITGDVQVNDTHLHYALKADYRLQESNLMLKKIKKRSNESSGAN